MAFISFALTEDEYRAGIKTVTRRDWSEHHMQMWQRFWDDGRHVHDAWTTLPFVDGAEKMGQFRLTCRPYWETLADMPEADLEAEGGMVDTLDEFYELIGKSPDEQVAVIRFEKVEE